MKIFSLIAHLAYGTKKPWILLFMARNGFSTIELMVSDTKIFKIYPYLPILGHLAFFVHMTPVEVENALEWPIMDGFSEFLCVNPQF